MVSHCVHFYYGGLCFLSCELPCVLNTGSTFNTIVLTPLSGANVCMWQDTQPNPCTLKCKKGLPIEVSGLCLPTVNTTVASMTLAITPFVWEHTYYHVTATCTVFSRHWWKVVVGWQTESNRWPPLSVLPY
jgi:hypothetical protein